MSNGLSIEMNNLLNKIKLFRREVKGGLSVLEFEEQVDFDYNYSNYKKITEGMNISEKKNSFLSILELLDTLELMIVSEAVFTDFDLFSNYLVLFTERFRLNDNMKKNLIFDFVERNIEIGVFREDALIVKQREVLKYSSIEDINSVDDIVNNEELFNKSKELTKIIQETHKLIKYSYLDKKVKTGELKNFTLDDVLNIEGALFDLNINKEIIESIIRVLKEKVCVEEKKFTYLSNVSDEKIKLSKREYREIEDELRKYFYFDSSTYKVNDLNNSIFVYKPMNERDKLRCVFLLRKGGYDVSTINAFLKMVQQVNINSGCLSGLYEDEYEAFFEEVREEYNLDSYLNDAREIVLFLKTLSSDSSEYFEWNSELKEIIVLVLESISKSQKSDYIKKRIKVYEKLEDWK